MKDTEILCLIQDSFPPHPLDPERAFDGGFGSYLSADEFRRDSKGLSWDQLDLRFLRFHYDCLQQLNPSAFADYLPAFLAIMITHRSSVDIIPWAFLAAITRSPNDAKIAEHCDKRINALTNQQKLTVMRVIEHLKETEIDESDKERLQKTLHEFQHSYLDGRTVK